MTIRHIGPETAYCDRCRGVIHSTNIEGAIDDHRAACDAAERRDAGPSTDEAWGYTPSAIKQRMNR